MPRKRSIDGTQRSWVLTFVAAACVISCGDSANESAVAPEQIAACRMSDGAPFEQLGADIDGDTLSVRVRFVGGCAQHDFVLCWPTQQFVETAPLSARLEVRHNSNEDGCEALVSEDLEFRLDALKQSWRSETGRDTGAISVSLFGLPRLLYEF